MEWLETNTRGPVQGVLFSFLLYLYMNIICIFGQSANVLATTCWWMASGVILLTCQGLYLGVLEPHSNIDWLTNSSLHMGRESEGLKERSFGEWVSGAFAPLRERERERGGTHTHTIIQGQDIFLLSHSHSNTRARYFSSNKKQLTKPFFTWHRYNDKPIVGFKRLAN